MSAPPLAKKPRTSTPGKNDDDGIPVPETTTLDYVNLTSHTDSFGVDPIPVSWGHPDPLVRGPIICTVRHSSQRNAIGAHSGSYCIYTGLAVAAGKLNPDYVPNLKLTRPVFQIGPHKSWSDPKKVASIDPFGHLTTEVYGAYLDKGFDIRPTIAVTKAHIDLPETREAVAAGRLIPDGKILMPNGQVLLARQQLSLCGICQKLRGGLDVQRPCETVHLSNDNGMYPELITRPDIKIFLPPIGGLTIYIWGDPDTIPDEDIELTCRVHDECNGLTFSAQTFAPVVLTLHMLSKSVSKLLKEVDAES
ncbi:GTP cyclohydrolase 2 [Skeletonema marinoi]|uniref:GTP cyclohydrolase 2 n=1 Tax=Skeletonema marinoi TaxID=267567 RepID=A0AAD8YLK4_9STRA|nr:GTP cyclohydrolase 2 [Skeletonema marinoi]